MELNAPQHTKELPAPLLYDRHQAAARLAISLRTLDQLLADGALACVRIGRAVRFRPSTLESFVEKTECRLSNKRRAAVYGRK